MDTEIDQNLELITREYVDFLDDMVDILIINICCQHNVLSLHISAILYFNMIIILLILFSLVFTIVFY